MDAARRSYELAIENQRQLGRLESELSHLKKVNHSWYSMQVEQFEQVKELARYRDAASIAKLIKKLPPDYLPSAAAEAKYQHS